MREYFQGRVRVKYQDGLFIVPRVWLVLGGKGAHHNYKFLTGFEA